MPFVTGDHSESYDFEEDLWTTWGKIINEWDTFGKKKLPHVKVEKKKTLKINLILCFTGACKERNTASLQRNGVAG